MLQSREFGFGFSTYTNEELKCVNEYRKIESNNTYSDPDTSDKIFGYAKKKYLGDHLFVVVF